MRRLTIFALALIATGPAAIAAGHDGTETVRVKQIVYRNDAIVMAPFALFAPQKGASLESNGQVARIRTTMTPGSKTGDGSLLVRTALSIPEKGGWSDLETTEFTGGIGAGATRTWHRTDGTIYRLVTSIEAGTGPSDNMSGR